MKLDSSSRFCGKAALHVLALPKAARTATRGLSVSQRESLNLRLVHPRRDVALFVQHAPDVDVLVALDVEDQVGVAPKWPESQIGKPELVRIAGRPRRRVPRDMGVGLLELVDEPEGHLRGGFDQVVVDCLLHVPVGELPRDDALHDFRAAVRRLIRSRSVAKYALSAAAAALELAPASSNPRS